MWKCSSCSAKNDDSFSFCCSCGAKRQEQLSIEPTSGLKTDGDSSGWRCKCGEFNKNDFAFCVRCGKARPNIEPTDWVCAKCGQKNSESSKFCSNCGSSKDPITKDPIKPPVSSTMVAVIAFSAVAVIFLAVFLFMNGSPRPDVSKHTITAPTITVHPESTVLEEGNSISLTVTAKNNDSGNTSLRYQWYKTDKNSNAYGNAIAGAQSASYVPEALPGTKYYYAGVWATDGSNTSKVVYSNPAAVRSSDDISNAPQNTPAAVNKSVSVNKMEFEISEGKATLVKCSKTTDTKNVDIPSEVDGNPVKCIDKAFGFCIYLRSVKIPESVTEITNNSFTACDELDTVYYSGAKEQWDKINIGGYGNEALSDATIIYEK